MRKRILILDDDAAILDILHVLLDMEDFEAITVERTDNLISLVSEYQPALILLDFYLNGLSGGDWCVQLKKHPEYKVIPVIIFTAASTKGLIKGSYGCNDFMAKPFDVDELIDRINILINNSEAVAGEYPGHMDIKPEPLNGSNPHVNR